MQIIHRDIKPENVLIDERVRPVQAAQGIHTDVACRMLNSNVQYVSRHQACHTYTPVTETTAGHREAL
jgi:serine/threonine protein kinase